MKIYYLLSVVIITSCQNSYKTGAEKVIDNSGKNSKELQDVINHYLKTKEPLKLEAAYFLVANMPGNYSINGKALEPVFNVYNDVLKVYNRGIKDFKILDSIAGLKIDSVLTTDGPLTSYKLKILPDQDNISASMLIENIDLAFDVWKKYKWAQHINFKTFCEYILPYRVRTEPLQNWRPYLYEDRKSVV